VIASNAKDVGMLIRSGRQQNGWTQQDLATRMGVSRQWVISAEAGSPTAHLGLVLSALRWVGLTLEVARVDAGADDVLDEITGGA